MTVSIKPLQNIQNDNGGICPPWISNPGSPWPDRDAAWANTLQRGGYASPAPAVMPQPIAAPDVPVIMDDAK